MEKKHYVLQYNRDPEDKYTKWETASGPYDSLEEIKAAKKEMLELGCYRIAESYTVTRYKAVKE